MSTALSLPWPEPSAETDGALAALSDYGDDVLASADRKLRSLSPETRRIVETLAGRIVAEFLRAPSHRLREASVSPEGILYARVVSGLFALDER